MAVLAAKDSHGSLCLFVLGKYANCRRPEQKLAMKNLGSRKHDGEEDRESRSGRGVPAASARPAAEPTMSSFAVISGLVNLTKAQFHF